MNNDEKRGRLYVVSTHIGNPEDITLRAIEVLKLCDMVICEELNIGSVLLKQLRIDKKLDTLNEQNEDEKLFEYIKMIQDDDKKLALVSDCGTPVFADPGYNLVRNALAVDINVIVVPGVTSLMTALVRSGLPLNQFLYAGFLSRTREERIDELIKLSLETRTVVVYDTPYRLLPLLEDASKVMPARKAYIGMNLTMPYETHHYGTLKELHEKFSDAKVKAEFVICFEGAADSELAVKFAHHRDEFKEELREDRREEGDEERRGERRERSYDKPYERRDRPYDRDRRGGGGYGGNRDRRGGGDRRESKPWDRDKKPYNSDRGGNRRESKPWDRDKKPYNSDRGGDRRESKPWDRDKKPYNSDRGGDRRESKPWDRDKKPYNSDRGGDRRESKPWDRDKKPFDRDKKWGDGDRKPFEKRDRWK
jgi:16S rRNA (cytidine1402-2'-O)-methyltransferase